MQPKLGILAGGGRLPTGIIDICQRTGRPFYVIAFEGHAEMGLFEDVPHSRVRLGAAGRTLGILRENNVEDIIFVGSVRRPSLAQLRPDMWAVKFLSSSGAMALGDDGFLTKLIRTLEQKEGFRVVGIADVAPELLAPCGVIGSLHPSDDDQADIRVAVAAALDLGAKDIGQAVIARDGRVVGREDSAGTDALLKRIAENSEQERGGVLVKMAKPQQERRADLPTIGITTIENAARAGLSGIVVEASGAIILDRGSVAEKADQLGLFVLGLYPKGDAGMDDKKNTSPVIYLLAGEPSGDLLGAALMAGIHETCPEARFLGIGGPAMIGKGLQSLFPMSDLSVMGIAEVVPRIALLLRRIREAAAHIEENRPDVVVTIDSPDFNFRVARRLKGKGIPLVHFVAPTVWAWRPGRAAKIAKLYDHLLALFPFEPPYFEREGLPTTFVGHPAVNNQPGHGARYRNEHNLGVDEPVLCLLPGSRRSEISRLLPIFLKTLTLIRERVPSLHAVIPTVPHLEMEIRQRVEAVGNIGVVVDKAQKSDAFDASTAALAASGTVALELAIAGVPSVIAYKVNAATAMLARRMIRIPFVSLVNILLGTEIMPERLQEHCTPDTLCGEILPLLVDENRRKQQLAAFEKVRHLLRAGDESPGKAAARQILHIIEARAKKL